MNKLLLLIIATMISSGILAQSDEDRGHPTNGGLYLSFSVGLAYLSINDDITNGPYNNMQFRGIGGAGDLKIGAAVKENFILHADIISSASGSVNVIADGNEIGSVSGDNSIGTIMFGGGATYYFMPKNIFISGTIGVGGFNVTSDGEMTSTQKGLGLYAKIGKEWWVSKNWDLGFSIGINYTNVNNEVDTMIEKLSGISARLSFSATFN